MATDNKDSEIKTESIAKTESIEDPHELLLSLVDMGSLDIEDVLLACVKEMSDAECKRVLSGLSLPNCCGMEDDEVDNETPAEVEEPDIIDDTVSADVEVEEPEVDVEEAEESYMRSLEAKISRLEKIAFGESRRPSLRRRANEATRYYYEWEPDYDRSVKIFNQLLADPNVNPEGLTIKDFKLKDYSDGFLAYGIDRLNLNAPEANQILQKARSFKTYDVKSGIFKDQNYLSLLCKKKVRKSEWYDPEFGPGFDRDEYMSNRRNAQWSKAQRDNHNWW